MVNTFFALSSCTPLWDAVLFFERKINRINASLLRFGDVPIYN